MLLTLENATELNGTYTWKFPKMKFTMCIQAYSAVPISYSFMYKGTNQEISQLIIPPNFRPYSFENDYFSIFFTENLLNLTPLIPSELVIEITPL